MRFSDIYIDKAISYIMEEKINRFILAIPQQLSAEEIFYLKDLEKINGLVLNCPPSEVTVDSKYIWLGTFNSFNYTNWILPACAGPVIFLGSYIFITKAMLKRIVASGRFSLYAIDNGLFKKFNVFELGLNIYANKFRSKVQSLNPRNPLRKAIYFLKKQFLIEKIVRNIYSRIYSFSNPPKEVYEKFFEIIEENTEFKIKDEPEKVLLVNNGLAAGGAERQIVNTLIGLEKSKQFKEVGLLCEYLGQSKYLEFFLDDLADTSIKVSSLKTKYTLQDDAFRSLSPPIAEIVRNLPLSLIEEIINLVYFFNENKPDVIHAWQDQTSIKVALAALISGIGKIVISGRNMNPTNFGYYQEYMEPIYKALANNKRITFLNNSFAGAKDYTDWLGIDPNRIKVIRNGLLFDDSINQLNDMEIHKYKEKLNIPEDNIIIGSIFRFWEEKDPILFLKTAKIVLSKNKNVHFLIVGEGPLREDMENYLVENKIDQYFTLPGTTTNISKPLLAMDIFLLTSLFEGTPNVLIEAQFFGLPVVSTDAGGSKEVYKINETGLLAEKRDPTQLAELIQIYIDNQDLRNKIKELAPLHIKKVFGLDRMINETINIYKKS